MVNHCDKLEDIPDRDYLRLVNSPNVRINRRNSKMVMTELQSQIEYQPSKPEDFAPLKHRDDIALRDQVIEYQKMHIEHLKARINEQVEIIRDLEQVFTRSLRRYTARGKEGTAR